MDERDHVATALRDMQAGETIGYRQGDGLAQVRLAEAIPFGHKLAIAPIRAGDTVRKYGEIIGRRRAYRLLYDRAGHADGSRGRPGHQNYR